MSFSSPQTKRDLLITFGLDPRKHVKDSFFHNANSAIRRSIWEQIPFDEKVTNIEDRIWASKVLEKGFVNLYDPEASVYHYHGIHHDNEKSRMNKTAKIIENFYIGKDKYGSLNKNNIKIISLIPHKGIELKYNGIPIIKKTIDYSLNTSCIDETIVLTDDPELGKFAESLGAKVPFIRDPIHSDNFVNLNQVYSFYYDLLLEKGLVADIVVSFEPAYVWRPLNLINDLINLLLSDGYDTVVPVVKNYGTAWIEKNGQLLRTDTGNVPEIIKKPLFLGAKGLGFVTHSEYIKNGDLLGNNCGMVPVDAKYLSVNIKTEDDLLAWDFS